MFGGGSAGFNPGAGGYGGYGGYGGVVAGAAPTLPLNAEAAGFNAVPQGGASTFGAPPQASQGLGGYMAQGETQGGGGTAAQEGQRAQRDSQSLMPLTLRMLLDAYETAKRRPEAGPDQKLHVNGREISNITFVACLESIATQPMFKVYNVNDSTARIQVKEYSDSDTPSENEPRPGDYVRVFGTLRTFGGDLHVTPYHIARVETPNEVPYHFVEVAYVHLQSTGKIVAKAAPPSSTAGGPPAPQGVAPGLPPRPAAGSGVGMGLPTANAAGGCFGGGAPGAGPAAAAGFGRDVGPPTAPVAGSGFGGGAPGAGPAAHAAAAAGFGGGAPGTGGYGATSVQGMANLPGDGRYTPYGMTAPGVHGAPPPVQHQQQGHGGAPGMPFGGGNNAPYGGAPPFGSALMR